MRPYMVIGGKERTREVETRHREGGYLVTGRGIQGADGFKEILEPSSTEILTLLGPLAAGGGEALDLKLLNPLAACEERDGGDIECGDEVDEVGRGETYPPPPRP